MFQNEHKTCQGKNLTQSGEKTILFGDFCEESRGLVLVFTMLEMKYVSCLLLLYYLVLMTCLRRRRKKSLTMSHIAPSVTTGSFSRGIREVGGICWDLLAQGIVALDLTLVMSWLQLGNVTAAFCPAWNCRVMDAERQEHFKLFSERPFSAPLMLVFWVWFSKQMALCRE